MFNKASGTSQECCFSEHSEEGIPMVVGNRIIAVMQIK
jgi:hypothetical protein